MTAVLVHKAQPFRDTPVANLQLVATEPFPEINNLMAARDTHDADGRLVVSALLASLPGGTVDAVLRLLLEHRASLLRVRWPE